MTERQTSLAYLHFSVILMGGPTLFAKLIDLPALSIVFGRGLFAMIGLYLFVIWRKQRIRPKSGRDLGFLVLAGLLMAIHWVLLFYAVQISTVAVGIISVNTHIIVTILIEPLIFRERLSGLDVLLGVVMFIGIVVLVPAFELSNQTTLGVLCGVLSALFLTGRNLVSRKFVQTYSSSVVMLFQLIVVAAVLSIPAFTVFDTDLGELFSWRMILFGLVFTALLHTLYVQSLTTLKAKTAGLISVLQIPYSIIAAMIFLAEYPPLRTLFGGVIVIGVVVVEMVRVK